MIYVSMIEIFFKAQEALVAQMGHRIGSWITVAAFFGGMLVIAIIDKLIPPGENPPAVLPTNSDFLAPTLRQGIRSALH